MLLILTGTVLDSNIPIDNFVKKYHLDLLKPGVASYKKKYENEELCA